MAKPSLASFASGGCDYSLRETYKRKAEPQTLDSARLCEGFPQLSAGRASCEAQRRMVVCSSAGRSTEADRPVSCQVVVPAVLQPTGAPPLTVSSRRAGWPIGERASAENWTNLGRSLFDTDTGSHRSLRSKYFWQQEAAHVQLNWDPSNLCEAQAALKERMPEQVPAQESSASPKGPGMKFPDKWPKLPGLAASLPVIRNIRTKTDTHN